MLKGATTWSQLKIDGDLQASKGGLVFFFFFYYSMSFSYSVPSLTAKSGNEGQMFGVGSYFQGFLFSYLEQLTI